ncbi:MAG TPA: TQO small subunit DoxD [Solirubrobacteraceae bacterium]|jgi:thiosulfate dehydrogenase [quinone] large subunit|nr:TQO small subunit DoxD [Solirubrobacteraceae bacterium]
MTSSARIERRRAPLQVRDGEPEARRLGLALFPLRLFLGVTFIYGGIQKLTDPGYLHPGAPTYIGTQLHGFANGTPGGFLLRAFAIPHPRLAGVAVALVEIAIGLLVTTGVFTRLAAAVGLALNLLLFLTNSWHTYPYFLGSDIVFVFAWLPYVLVGASRQPSLEPLLDRWVAASASARGTSLGRRRPAGDRAEPSASGPELTRRTAIGATLGVLGAATATIAGLSVLSRGSYRAARTLGASIPTHTATKAKASAAGATGSTPPADIAASSPSSLPAGAVKLGAASQLPAGQGATYPDPKTGNPDIVIRESNGTLVAHSAVCTHAGCTVGYQGGQIVCPCHGAVYDAHTGAVISGPAPTGLAPAKVIEQGGEIYAVPS